MGLVEVISVAVELMLVANVVGTVVVASLPVEVVDWSCLTCCRDVDVGLASGTVTTWVTVAIFWAMDVPVPASRRKKEIGRMVVQ